MEYARNAWYVAAWSEEVTADKPTAMQIMGERIVLWRAGRCLVAMEDRCVHRLAPLSLGRCEDGHLRCMYHGILFDDHGQVVKIPGQELIPQTARVRTYPAVERHGWIWIWMGEAARADDGLIPEVIGLDSPDYHLGHGHLDYAAEAALISNNLLDFSHLPYVHANTFQPPEDFAASTPKVTPLERGVRFERWVESQPGGAGEPGAPICDNWEAYDFVVPGIMLLWVGSFPVGTAKAFGHKRPDYALATYGVTYSAQAVTPMGHRSARYFFSWGPHRDHGDEAARDMLVEFAGQIFGEDRDMIEAQQRVIDATSNPRVMPTAHDRGVTIYNRLIERLVRDEQRTEQAA